MDPQEIRNLQEAYNQVHQPQEVAEEVVVAEPSDAELKEQTKEFIAQLKPALKFYEGAEKKEFQEYIKSIEAFLKTLD